jgi:superfamily I DNA/RNA helicase
VALICPDSWSERLASGLEDAGLDFGVPERDGLDQPVTLVPVGVVKGLEFDAVVVVEPAAIAAGPGWGGAESPARPTTTGLRALYVALTRPTRRLAVVHSAPLPAGLQVP